MLATIQPPRTVYDELESRVRPLLDAHESDLEIDRQVIADNPGVPFLHYTRPHGTALTLLHNADSAAFPARGERVPYLFGTADREHILREVAAMAELHARPNGIVPVAVYYYDGRRLLYLTPADAVKVARQYRNRVQDDWDRTR